MKKDYTMQFIDGWYYITENGRLKYVVNSFQEALKIIQETL